jgi:two-component system nitrate/nitrite response regulator NarL
MPGLTGLEVLKAARAESLPTRVVFLTAVVKDEDIATAVAFGVSGLVLKDAVAAELRKCLAVVASGGHWLPMDLVEGAATREAARRTESERVVEALTARERELTLLVTQGLSNKEIAYRLGVAEATVKIHLHNIYHKLGVTNRTSLAALALAHLDRLKFR